MPNTISLKASKSKSQNPSLLSSHINCGKTALAVGSSNTSIIKVPVLAQAVFIVFSILIKIGSAVYAVALGYNPVIGFISI